MFALRAWAILQRGLGRLWRLTARRDTAALDGVVEDALPSTSDLSGRMDVHARRTTRELHRLRTSLTKSFGELSKMLRAQGESQFLRVEGAQRAAVQKALACSAALVELNQQLAAVRDYAARQQDQVRRLQEGYDWSVLKSLSLRIIRCVDGLDRRLHDLPETDPSYTGLRDLRDELVYALEGSGVERFEPEKRSRYAGQENCAEVIRQAAAERAEEVGHIAEALQAGYRVYGGDGAARIVRPARVSVFVAQREGESDGHNSRD